MAICIFHKKQINEEYEMCETCIEEAAFLSMDNFGPHPDPVFMRDDSYADEEE